MMTITFTIGLIGFVPSLLLALWASDVLVRGLDAIAERLELAPSIQGLVTAFGADSPEIASAVLAVFAGAHDVGIGVVLGSNLVNLATLLGLSAVIAGHLRAPRAGLVLNGGLMLLMTLAVGALLFHLAPVAAVVAVAALLFVGVVVLLWLRPGGLLALPLPAPLTRALFRAGSDAERQEREAAQERRGELHIVVHHREAAAPGDHQCPSSGEAAPVSEPPDEAHPRWQERWASVTVPVSLVLIVGASYFLLHAALTIGARWGVPQYLVGTVILAGLTSIPNVYAAISLARRGRERVVVSEAVNSNSINMLVGAGIPALVAGLGPVKATVRFDYYWLLGLTLLSLWLLGRKQGLTRAGGAIVIGGYLAFVGSLIVFGGAMA